MLNYFLFSIFHFNCTFTTLFLSLPLCLPHHPLHSIYKPLRALTHPLNFFLQPSLDHLLFLFPSGDSTPLYYPTSNIFPTSVVSRERILQSHWPSSSGIRPNKIVIDWYSWNRIIIVAKTLPKLTVEYKSVMVEARFVFCASVELCLDAEEMFVIADWVSVSGKKFYSEEKMIIFFWIYPPGRRSLKSSVLSPFKSSVN